MASRRKRAIQKIIATATAIVLIISAKLGGTFAWQSISQQALNEVVGIANPGGRLHDDFNGTNKDIYVENFTSLGTNGVNIYARIRLDEYIEIGEKAGTDEATDLTIIGATPEHTPDRKDVSTWTTYIPGDDENNIFREYFAWSTGGQTIYLPTFNMNRDSLSAEVNGSYNSYNPAQSYTDYVVYTENQEVFGIEVYDADDNATDEDPTNSEGTGGTEDVNYTLAQTTHTAKKTLDGMVISMKEWLKLPDNAKKGNFWVWDEDGWAYWARPIEPGTATGLLLDGIAQVGNVGTDWYYGINVVAQFVTENDLGQDDQTGFYNLLEGSAPTANALTLLKTIGVKTMDYDIEITDSDAVGGYAGYVTPNGYDDEVLGFSLSLDGEAVTDEISWSVEAEDSFAMAGNTGFSNQNELVIDANQPSPTILIVTAKDEHGNALASRPVFVCNDIAIYNTSIASEADDIYYTNTPYEISFDVYMSYFDMDGIISYMDVSDYFSMKELIVPARAVNENWHIKDDCIVVTAWGTYDYTFYIDPYTNLLVSGQITVTDSAFGAVSVPE